jgi:hypothetical protein
MRWAILPARRAEHPPKRLCDLLSVVLAPGHAPWRRASLISNGKVTNRQV